MPPFFNPSRYWPTLSQLGKGLMAWHWPWCWCRSWCRPSRWSWSCRPAGLASPPSRECGSHSGNTYTNVHRVRARIKQTFHAYHVYCKISNISHTLVGNKIVYHSDVFRASPIGAASSTSSFSTEQLASKDCAKTTARWDGKHLNFVIGCILY